MQDFIYFVLVIVLWFSHSFLTLIYILWVGHELKGANGRLLGIPHIEELEAEKGQMKRQESQARDILKAQRGKEVRGLCMTRFKR